jgi:dolichol-phosphate mannosyltransferase
LLSVILPCYNEAGAVGRYANELLPALAALGVPFEVLAVDDGSRDGTGDALRRLPVTVLAHETNRGMGAAIRTGLAAAKGELCATLDADLSFAPAQLAAMLAKQRETNADLVAGSPFLKPEGMAAVPWARRAPSLMLNALYRGLFSHALTSYTPVFRLYRTQAVRALPLTSDGFEINAEIAARMARLKSKLAEVPVVLTERREGVSKLARARELKRHARLIATLLSERT